ncbi:MAG: hypothetical protein MJE77_31060 [Proteobacteria bacterium]|nr:hypothetical protein [Pseudomonadota bacterium]
MFDEVQKPASALGVTTPVELLDVPDADHDHAKMAPAVQPVLIQSQLPFR